MVETIIISAIVLLVVSTLSNIFYGEEIAKLKFERPVKIVQLIGIGLFFLAVFALGEDASVYSIAIGIGIAVFTLIVSFFILVAYLQEKRNK